MALAEEFSDAIVSHYKWLIILLFCGYFLHNRYRRHVRSIPGPFLASFTDIWRFLNTLTGIPHETHLDLHQKYKSNLVRIGPNVISVSNPDFIPIIYGLNSGFTKSAFYDVFLLPCNGEFTNSLFNTRDEKYHAKYKRPIASAYSMSTLVEFEPFVDTTTKLFIEKLDRFAESGAAVDIGVWLQMYAFDVVGEIIFGKKLGFLESGADVQGIMSDIRFMIRYCSVVGQIPWLNWLGLRNPLAIRAMGIHPITKFALERMEARVNSKSEGNKPGPRDFLARAIEAQQKHPDLVTDRIIRTLNTDNVSAGSDTTAMALRSALYHMMKNPATLKKLISEVDAADARGDLGEFVSWKAAKQMPYLEAVVKEAVRIHPAVGQLLERDVPKGGVVLDGHFLPQGTVVGMNPWVAARNRDVYGHDADIFRPERWLEATEEQLSLMEKTSLSFGHGSRTCIGKNISLLEIYKIIPQLVRTYEFSFVNPKDEWHVHGGWFAEQDNFHVKLRRRVKAISIEN